jgi:tellurite methyltransferase
MAEKRDWQAFYENAKEYPPSPLLVRALSFVEHKEKAIELGGGALNDARFLLTHGFDVTDLDKEKLKPEFTKGLDPKKFHLIVSSFADFNFPTDEYDLASAMFSLPFNPPDTFDRVFESVKKSLHVGGIFCGNLFGERDGWRKESTMTSHTETEAKKLLADMETVAFGPREWDGKLADGTPKHWHTYNFIARKI